MNSLKRVALNFRSRFRRPEWVFVVLAIFSGLLLAILIPAGAGFDEPSHIARVEQIVDGKILPQTVQKKDIDTNWSAVPETRFELYGGYSDVALVETSVQNMRSLHTTNQAYAFPTWRDEHIVSGLSVGQLGSTPFVFSNSAINSPIVYVPHIVGYLAARLVTANAYAVIVAMRIAGLLFYACAVFFCIKAIPIGRWALASVALIPNSLITNSMVSADMVTFVMVIALISLSLKAITDQTVDKRLWVLLGLASFVLSLSKIAYVPFLLVLLLIPLIGQKRVRRKSWIKVIVIWFCSSLLWLLWYLVIRNINTGAMYKSTVDAQAQMQFIIGHPVGFLKIIVSNLLGSDLFSTSSMGVLSVHGGFNYGGSITLFMIILAVMVDAGLIGRQGLRQDLKAFAWIMIICISFSLILIELAVYTQFVAVGSNVTEGAQDRYFLPLVLPAILSGLSFTFLRTSEIETIDISKRISNGFIISFQVLTVSVLLLQLAYSLFSA